MDITHDETGRKFSLEADGHEAYLVYAMRDGRTMDATSTFTPQALRGQGLASRLTRAALDHARELGWRVIPSCWYVAGWIDRHPEYEDLRAG